MTIQELGAEVTHVRFNFWSCKHQEDKQWRSYLSQPKTTQQHLTTATIPFIVTFSTGYLARNCQVLLKNLITYSAVLTLPPWAQFSKNPVFPTEPLEWTAQVSPGARKPAIPQPPAPVPGEAPGPATTPGTTARAPGAAPGHVHAGPQSTLTQRPSGGRQDGPAVAGTGARSRDRSEQRSTVPAPDAEPPQEAAGPPQEALPPPAPALLGGRLPGRAPPSGAAGRMRGRSRGLREGRRGGGGQSHSALPGPRPGAERGVTVQLVCFP